MVPGPQPGAAPPRRSVALRRVLLAVGVVVGGIAGWMLLRDGPPGLGRVVTVDAAGDTLVYSGSVRDAIARDRIVEAFNSVAVPRTDSADAAPGENDGGTTADARGARQAAIDELARLYSRSVDPAALLGALNVAIIEFEPGEAALPEETTGFIRAAAETIERAPPGTVVIVVGYANGGGDPADDLALSVARATAVATALTHAGLSEERLRVEGLGDGTTDHAGHIAFRLSDEPEP